MLVADEVVVDICVELFARISVHAFGVRHVAHDRGAVDGTIVDVHGRHLRRHLGILHGDAGWGSAAASSAVWEKHKERDARGIRRVVDGDGAPRCCLGCGHNGMERRRHGGPSCYRGQPSTSARTMREMRAAATRMLAWAGDARCVSIGIGPRAGSRVDVNVAMRCGDGWRAVL